MFRRNLITQLTAWSMALAFSAFAVNSVAFAGNDDSELLTIGSKAPQLDIEHWVSNGEGRFKPVKKFESGKVYVVEFWATWCGPCIQSMPHLSSLQEKYADKGVQIISISDEDLETVEEFLEKKVRGESEKTYAELTGTYCLTTDPDQSSYTDYMEAAEQNGIPSAFIVGKKGVIEWIGHPMEMDEPLEKVIGDKWDRVAYLKKKEADDKAMADINKRAQMAMQNMQEGDSAAAIEGLDSLIKDYADHPLAPQMKGMRQQLVIMGGGEPAATALEALAKENSEPEALNQLAWSIVEMKMNGTDVDATVLAAATRIANQAAEADPTSGPILDTLAHLLHMGGELDKAIEVQKKALENAGDMKGQIEPFLKELEKEKAKMENKSDDE